MTRCVARWIGSATCTAPSEAAPLGASRRHGGGPVIHGRARQSLTAASRAEMAGRGRPDSTARSTPRPPRPAAPGLAWALGLAGPAVVPPSTACSTACLDNNLTCLTSCLERGPQTPSPPPGAKASEEVGPVPGDDRASRGPREGEEEVFAHYT